MSIIEQKEQKYNKSRIEFPLMNINNNIKISVFWTDLDAYNYALSYGVFVFFLILNRMENTSMFSTVDMCILLKIFPHIGCLIKFSIKWN